MAELPGSGTSTETPPSEPTPVPVPPAESPPQAAGPDATEGSAPVPDPALDRGPPNPLAAVPAPSHQAFLQDFSFPGGGHGVGSVLTGQPPVDAPAEEPEPEVEE